MSGRSILRMPQYSSNDEAATLLEWLRDDGDLVPEGAPLYTAETTKAVFDVDAESGGYLTRLVSAGERVPVGSPVAVISEEPEESELVQAWLREQEALREEKPVVPAAGERGATKKAEILAKKMEIDLSQVPAAGEKITEADVLAFAEKRKEAEAKEPSKVLLQPVVKDTGKNERILVIGGGNAAVQVIDALKAYSHRQSVCIFDDNPALHGTTVMGVPVIGPVSLEKAQELLKNGEIDAAVVAVGNVPFRAKIFTEWHSAGIPFTNVIHPTVHASPDARIGTGNVIMAFCHLGACSSVGDNNLLSAYTDIEHHCVLGSHCSFGPGIFFSGNVKMGDRVRLGTGIYIEPLVTVGSDCVIASGVALTAGVPENSLVKTRAGYAVRKRRPQRNRE